MKKYIVAGLLSALVYPLILVLFFGPRVIVLLYGLVGILQSAIVGICGPLGLSFALQYRERIPEEVAGLLVPFTGGLIAAVLFVVTGASLIVVFLGAGYILSVGALVSMGAKAFISCWIALALSLYFTESS